MKRVIKTPAKEGSIPREKIKEIVQRNPPTENEWSKTLQISRDEVIEILMDEWWNDLRASDQNRLIKDYLDDINGELIEEENG